MELLKNFKLLLHLETKVIYRQKKKKTRDSNSKKSENRYLPSALIIAVKTEILSAIEPLFIFFL